MTLPGKRTETAGRDRPAIEWAGLPGRLRGRGLRWTEQRRILVDVLRRTDGHVTGAELVERCRAIDPATTPSTVYRTLDVLEELGVVRHGHRADGREEFHVLPAPEHGHRYCRRCEGSWEIDATEAEPFVRALAAARGFAVDLSHVTVVGECRSCRDGAPGAGDQG